jgi:hypothetical protein
MAVTIAPAETTTKPLLLRLTYFEDWEVWTSPAARRRCACAGCLQQPDGAPQAAGGFRPLRLEFWTATSLWSKTRRNPQRTTGTYLPALRIRSPANRTVSSRLRPVFQSYALPTELSRRGLSILAVGWLFRGLATAEDTHGRHPGAAPDLKGVPEDVWLAVVAQRFDESSAGGPRMVLL